jgi:hypothetical protein
LTLEPPTSLHRHRWVVNVELNEAYCRDCPLVLETDCVSVDGIRAAPAPADVGHLGTGSLAQAELNGKGQTDLETGASGRVVDFGGKQIQRKNGLAGGLPHDFSLADEELEEKLAEDIRFAGKDDYAVTSGLALFRARVREADKARAAAVWNAYCELAGRPGLKRRGAH